MRRIFTIVLIVSAILMFSSCARKPDGKVNDLFDRTVSANEALEIAKNSDVVVIEKSGCTSGQDVWDRFYARTQKGRADSVLCAHYYIGGVRGPHGNGLSVPVGRGHDGTCSVR